MTRATEDNRPVERTALVPEWPPVDGAANAPFVPRTLRDVEARHISEVLRVTRGRIGEAAKLLGVHRNTLTRKIREYNL